MATKKQKILRTLIIYLASFVAVGILLTGLLFLLVFTGTFGLIPGKDALASIRNEEASLVYSSDHKIIGKYFAENRTNITWDEVPASLVNALIATEDKRFYTHHGIDTKSYFRVFIKSILLGDSSGGGGSTLTQQLAKNLYGRSDFGFLSVPVNKIKELFIAARLEAIYSKDELILLYLNSVPFGENVYGVETAARRYFNKSASDLNVQESAVLVGLLKANTYFNPRLYPENSLERRNLVLGLMEKEQFLLPREADSLRNTPLNLHYDNESLNSATGYFVYQVKKQTLDLLETIKINTDKEYNLEKDGLKIYSTLNMRLQDMAFQSIKSHLPVMQKLLDRELDRTGFKKQWYADQKQRSVTDATDAPIEMEVFDWGVHRTQNLSPRDSLWHYYKMLHAAVLITHPQDGSVLTWIGGNDFGVLPFDMVLSHRQIASAFKPVLYATALENGFTPCTYLENEEKTYPEYDDWTPQNFEGTSTPDSTVALWYALVHSMNIPTVDLYFKSGRENLLNTCLKLRFPPAPDEAPSIALGTLDLSLAEIVSAYASFANRGERNELVLIDSITDARGKTLYVRASAQPVRVFSEETSDLITAMLQTVVNQGTGSNLRSQFGIQAELAGKTGTAQNYSDSWFLAYTPDLVLGTWVGARTPDVHFVSANGTGSALALPIVAKVLQGVEGDAGLSNTFLIPFLLPDEFYSFMQCPPYREKGILGFLDRMFSVENISDTASAGKVIIAPPVKIEEKVNPVRGFFQRLFGGKKK